MSKKSTESEASKQQLLLVQKNLFFFLVKINGKQMNKEKRDFKNEYLQRDRIKKEEKQKNDASKES